MTAQAQKAGAAEQDHTGFDRLLHFAEEHPEIVDIK